MFQTLERFHVSTSRAGLVEITAEVGACLTRAGIERGIVTVYVRHTSCSLLIQENADPDVRADLMSFFRKLVPEGMEFIVHDVEGPDDMPAHIKATLTQTSLSIPVEDGHMLLGTWQGIYLFEHRHRPHRREVVVHVLGD